MILTLDLGNTDLFIGVIDDDKVIETYRTSTDIHKSGDEYAFILKTFLKKHIENDDIEGIICSSVVPPLNLNLKMAIKRLFNKELLFVQSGLKTGLPIRIDNPNELGADLVCDCVGAIAKYGYPIVSVDLGTASKILVVDKNGAYIGGTISAGIKISIEALARKTANLSETSLDVPTKIINKNTIDCINAGTILGEKIMIEGIVNKMEEELGYKVKRVVTGGYSHIMPKLDGFTYDYDLVHFGLAIIYRKNVYEK